MNYLMKHTHLFKTVHVPLLCIRIKQGDIRVRAWVNSCTFHHSQDVLGTLNVPIRGGCKKYELCDDFKKDNKYNMLQEQQQQCYPARAWPVTRELKTASVMGKSLFFMKPNMVLKREKNVVKINSKNIFRYIDLY